MTCSKLLFGEWAFHCKYFQELFFASFVVIALDNAYTTVPDDIRNIHTNTLTHQCVTTLLIDNRTLLVHDVIVFQQTLTDTEVVFFNLLLGTLDTIRYH